MTDKIAILQDLGESALLLPEAIARALAANDRVKYLLALLQQARDQGARPLAHISSLSREREASGVDDATLDGVVAASTQESQDVLHIPRAGSIHAQILEGVTQMLEPLRADATGERHPAVYAHFKRRFDTMTASAPSLEHDRVPVSYVENITRGRRDGEDVDGLHVLVMDLHREINGLQRSIATETVDGATVYALGEGDRTHVAAFMAGLNGTAFLKFDHPGLGTTATRTGDRLIIQNDIGTTDNHVIVIHVSALTITLTYTDVHAARLQFFQAMLTPAEFQWSRQGGSESSGSYEMCVGTATAADETDLDRRLTVIGSRLVFLIDWNRARKRLRRFVKNADAISILTWAAQHQVGHRAFLQTGDVQLIETAMERLAPQQIRFGARLDEILGREAARVFLRAVLRITAEGLRDGKSPRLVQDQIHAELLTHVQTGEQTVLALASDHAAMVSALAELARDTLMRAEHLSSPEAMAPAAAARAKAWETRADGIVHRARTLLRQAPGDGALLRFLGEADDVADGLEEAVFLSTLMTAASRQGLQLLCELADLFVPGSRSYVRCLEWAREAHHVGTADDLEEFLVAVDEVIRFEHDADDKERRVKAALITAARDFRELHVLAEIARCFEDGADTLARCALALRDYVLDSRRGR